MAYIPYKIAKNMDADTIHLLNITTRNKQHQNCNLKIMSSKNDVHRGLYCCNHKKWLQWITYEQETTLKNFGIKAEPSPYTDLSWE